MTRGVRIAVGVVVAVVLGGCGGGNNASPPPTTALDVPLTVSTTTTTTAPTTSTTLPPPPDPCSLLTPGEAAAFLGGPVTVAPRSAGSLGSPCDYTRAGAGGTLEVSLLTAEQYANYQQTFGSGATAVAGVGDEASRDSLTGALLVRAGDHRFLISVFLGAHRLAPADQVVALARLILGRL